MAGNAACGITWVVTPCSEQDLLAVVNASPEAVAQHDKAAWLDLFAVNGVVEDPVGSRPVTGRERIARFYETFIAPNRIRFHVDRDIVCGMHVMRDLTIEIAMSERVTVRVPVHLLYELVEEEGRPRIARLAAHWELLPMLKQQAGSGIGFLGVGTASALRMLRQMGLSGALGFGRAAASVGKAGKERLQDFAQGRELSLDAMAAGATVEFPATGVILSLAGFAGSGPIKLSKILAAGRTVSATCAFEWDGRPHAGVVLCEFAPDSLALARVSFYV